MNTKSATPTSSSGIVSSSSTIDDGSLERRRSVWLLDTNSSGTTTCPVALIEYDHVVYIICKRSLLIGRHSQRSPPDIAILDYGCLVSRGHLHLQLTDDGQWSLKCNGKNGIFIDATLQQGQRNSIVHLPHQCTLRFPSTEFRLQFQSLLHFTTQKGDNSISDDSGYASLLPTDEEATRSSISSPLSVRNETVSFDQLVDQPLSSSSDSSKIIMDKPDELGARPDRADCSQSNASPDDDYDAAEWADRKPPFSYAQLIVQAIASRANRQLTLSEIYSFITNKYPYYRTCDKCWQNSIRHNLSLNRYFVKIARSQYEPGKGNFWGLDSTCENKLIQLSYRQRRGRQPPSDCGSASASEKAPRPRGAGSHAIKKAQRQADSGGKDEGVKATNAAQSFCVPVKAVPTDSTNSRKRRFGSIDLYGRFMSHSAPSSPKRHLQRYGTGPFSIMTDGSDGRQRLQLCPSPPSFVSVASPDTSALKALSEESRSRRSSETSQHSSKSLCSTPVRDITYNSRVSSDVLRNSAHSQLNQGCSGPDKDSNKLTDDVINAVVHGNRRFSVGMESSGAAVHHQSTLLNEQQKKHSLTSLVEEQATSSAWINSEASSSFKSVVPPFVGTFPNYASCNLWNLASSATAGIPLNLSNVDRFSQAATAATRDAVLMGLHAKLQFYQMINNLTRSPVKAAAGRRDATAPSADGGGDMLQGNYLQNTSSSGQLPHSSAVCYAKRVSK